MPATRGVGRRGRAGRQGRRFAGREDVPPGRGGPAAGLTPPPATSATSSSTIGGLMPHDESLMRHCASVSEQPQGQPSSFTRRSTSSRCSGVSTDRSTPGISVACAALASRI